MNTYKRYRYPPRLVSIPEPDPVTPQTSQQRHPKLSPRQATADHRRCALRHQAFHLLSPSPNTADPGGCQLRLVSKVIAVWGQ